MDACILVWNRLQPVPEIKDLHWVDLLLAWRLMHLDYLSDGNKIKMLINNRP